MRHISTRNLVVKKLYGEVSNSENEMLNVEIKKNWKLLEDIEAFSEIKEKLESETYKPSKSSVQIILDHSRKTAPVTTSC